MRKMQNLKVWISLVSARVMVSKLLVLSLTSSFRREVDGARPALFPLTTLGSNPRKPSNQSC